MCKFACNSLIFFPKSIQRLVEPTQKLFDKYVAKMLEFRRQHCFELVSTSDLNGVTSLCELLDILATPTNGVNPADQETFERTLELWFIFSLIWSVGASVDDDSRKKMDNFLRELEGQFPAKDTVFEYCVDVKSHNWAPWEDKLKGNWRYPPK